MQMNDESPDGEEPLLDAEVGKGKPWAVKALRHGIGSVLVVPLLILKLKLCVLGLLLFSFRSILLLLGKLIALLQQFTVLFFHFRNIGI